MDEQGFDFTPVRKDTPKRFEPPPWEREAFEELERKRAESEAAERALRADEGPTQPEKVGVEQVGGPVQQTEAPEATTVGANTGPTEPIPESQMIEMLAALAAEEPAEPKGLFAVGIGAGLVLAAIGGVLIVWAMAALVGSARTGWMGQVSGIGIGIFGVFFLGMGVWMVYRTLRRRGVL